MKRLRISGASRSRGVSWGSFALLSGAASLVVGTIWLSLQFMVDPRSVVWMNQFLPEAAKIPTIGWDDPKTFAEIQADLSKAKLVAGEPLRVQTAFKSGQRTTDLLLPVFRRQDDCPGRCETLHEPPQERLVEVRVYRNVLNPTPHQKEALQFLNQLDVRELEESFVVAPLVEARTIKPSSNRSLPFTKVERFEEPVSAGTWLMLNGQLHQGDATIAYGQIVYYNPVTTQIFTLLPWTSPKGKLPAWQKVPKGRPVELMVDQTVGLEPNFRVYQLRSSVTSRKAPSFKLQPISLTQPAIDNGILKEALFLARNGLWSSALEMMQSVKRQQPGSGWSTLAQAQMDLVARHAKMTQAQADQPSASVSQQILTNLLDGRWAKAAQMVQMSPDNRDEILELLKFDSGRIQKRIQAALSLNQTRTDVQTWAALRLTAKSGKSQAIVWLNKQPQDSLSNLAKVVKLLNQLEPASLSNGSAPSAQPTTVLQKTRKLNDN